MTSKKALDKLVSKTGILDDTCASLENCIKTKKCRFNEPCETCDDYNLVKTITQDLERFKELVKVIRILKKRKYAEWIKNKFYDGVGYEEEEEKLFKKVFGSSWRKY